jgi:hypothetical protein
MLAICPGYLPRAPLEDMQRSSLIASPMTTSIPLQTSRDDQDKRCRAVFYAESVGCTKSTATHRQSPTLIDTCFQGQRSCLHNHKPSPTLWTFLGCRRFLRDSRFQAHGEALHRGIPDALVAGEPSRQVVKTCLVSSSGRAGAAPVAIVKLDHKGGTDVDRTKRTESSPPARRGEDDGTSGRVHADRSLAEPSLICSARLFDR